MTEPEQQQHEEYDDQNIPHIPFTREDLVNNHMLRNTDYKPALHELIKKANIYESTKRMLETIVDNYFSDNRFLTNLNDGGVRNDILGTNLDLERDLLFGTASVCPSDLRNPDYTNLISNIFSHNRPTVLRAVGKQRERIQQGRITMSSEQTITRSESPPQQTTQQPQKKRFLSFLGGK